MMVKPTLQFKNLSESQLAQYGENILTKMSENQTLFPDPDPSLIDLETALVLYRNALTDAAYRDMRAVELKNQRQEELKMLIFKLSLYVSKVSSGDRAMILAAGFLPSKGAEPIGAAPKPLNVRVDLMQDNPGYVRLRVNAWRPALVYQFEYRRKRDGELWERTLSSKSTIMLSGLESLEAYEFRVAYINSNPLVTYSDVVSMYVV